MYKLVRLIRVIRKIFGRKKILCVLVLLSSVLAGCTRPKGWQHDEGLVFGTVYSITYLASDDYQAEIDSVLQKVDNALSMFNEQSIISAVNRGEGFIPQNDEGDMFCEVLSLAHQVSSDTNGAFDITVAPLVNAWGFGFRQGTMPDSAAVDSLRQFVGWQQVALVADGDARTISRDDPRIMLDCSAIAKGYGCDVVGRLLRAKGVENYMVEIGGEVVVQGNSPRNADWRIGVNKPTDDACRDSSSCLSAAVSNELQAVLSITNVAMATSGNYRNFYYKGGRKYAHTIDPRTGYPVQHELLSATVLAADCATADAYATSFMVMGLDSARKVLDRHPDLKAYLIYTDQHDSLTVWHSPELNIEN